MTLLTDARRGYLYVTLAAVLFGFSGNAAKYLFNRGMSPFQLIQLRVTIAWAGLFLLLLVRRRDLLHVHPRDLFYFAALGIFGIAAAQFFYLFAISKIDVAVAILLHYTGPVFVALYTAAVLHRKLSIGALVAIIGTLTGCFLVVEAHDLNLLLLNRTGIGGGILAAVAFATYSILSERGMKTYTPWTVLFYGLLFAVITWNILHPPLAAIFRDYTPIEWVCIGFIGTLGTIVPFGFYFEGVKRISATHASITATLETGDGRCHRHALLGERMTGLQMLGGLIVISAIVGLQWRHDGSH